MNNWSLNLRTGILAILVTILVINTPVFVSARSVDRIIRNTHVNISDFKSDGLSKLSAVQSGLPEAPPILTGSIEINQNPAYINYTPDELVQNIFIAGCLKASNVLFMTRLFWNLILFPQATKWNFVMFLHLKSISGYFESTYTVNQHIGINRKLLK